jgi:hypothetical protein
VIDQQEHEQKLVLSFLKRLDMTYVVEIPPSLQRLPDVLKILKTKGAPDTCYALSEKDELDGRQIVLQDALQAVIGYGMGTSLLGARKASLF